MTKDSPSHMSKLIDAARAFVAVDGGARFDRVGAIDDTSIRIVLWTSVEDALDAICVSPTNDGFLVALGPDASGMAVRTVERQEQRRLEKLIVRDLGRAGCDVSTKPRDDSTTILFASKKTDDIDSALESVSAMADVLLGKLGMEAALRNLIERRGNVDEVMDEQTAGFLAFDDDPRETYPDTVFLTELTTCTRCRGKWDDVVRLTREWPDVAFRIVFLNKSRAVFKQKIFSVDRPDLARSGQVVPMLFLAQDGRLVDVIGTTLEEPPPSEEAINAAFERHFAR